MNNKDISRIKMPLLTGNCVITKKQELKDYFNQTWREYESLFALINDDKAYFLKPEPLRHPLIFYFGHTATFYINKFILGKFITDRINSKLEAICAVGVDEMSWDDLNNAHYDWPSVDEVKIYRTQVALLVEQLIDEMKLTLPIKKDSLAWIILMGCEHERIHLETSSVIMRMLQLKYLTANDKWVTCSDSAIPSNNTMVPISGKKIIFGKRATDRTFGWDNEYGEDTLTLDNFNVSKYLVSNQEYLAFIKAGGYQNLQFWSEEGQQWLKFSNAKHPHFWVEKTSKGDSVSYWQRNLLNEIPLPLNWPVEVNYLEAKAFCQWKNSKNSHLDNESFRLLTEAEWLCLRDNVEGDVTNWQEAPGNINREYFASSCPVDKFEHAGIYDIVGNVWQWTESVIDGFQGFEVHPLYDDFSTPTFDGKHNLIKGGSWISTGNEAQKSSRYAFRRHFFQHAGFRYVQSYSDKLPNLEANHYETDNDICQQLHSHYFLGTDKLASLALPAKFDNYQKTITEQVMHYVDKYEIPTNKCLDLGCSVGRTSFTLAQHFQHVDAVDFSARYIQHGVNLQQGKSVRYQLQNEGEIVDFHEISLANVDLPCSQNIQFSQGDLSNLKNNFIGYDLIIVQQVLEESYNPSQFLQSVHERMNKNALLIVVSTYNFDEQKTEKSNWLGGRKINGENVTGLDGLSLLLNKHFTFLAQQDLTRAIQINNRHFTLSFPHLSVWQLN